MPPFHRLLRSIALALAAAALACGDEPSGPSTEGYPDISGRWTLAMSAVPSGTNGFDGSCEFDPIAVELSPSRTEFGTAFYSGTQEGVRIVCSGFTEAATASSGWRDTVVVVPSDTMSATVSTTGCFIGLPCNGEGIFASIRITGALHVSGRAHEQTMSGDLYYIDGGWIRLEGSFDASR